MRKLSEKKMTNGRTRVVVELEPGEVLLAVSDGAHYQLGQPLDDVVAAHTLAETERVTWCPVEQKWVPAG